MHSQIVFYTWILYSGLETDVQGLGDNRTIFVLMQFISNVLLWSIAMIIYCTAFRNKVGLGDHRIRASNFYSVLEVHLICKYVFKSFHICWLIKATIIRFVCQFLTKCFNLQNISRLLSAKPFLELHSNFNSSVDSNIWNAFIKKKMTSINGK